MRADTVGGVTLSRGAPHWVWPGAGAGAGGSGRRGLPVALLGWVTDERTGTFTVVTQVSIDAPIKRWCVSMHAQWSNVLFAGTVFPLLASLHGSTTHVQSLTAEPQP